MLNEAPICKRENEYYSQKLLERDTKTRTKITVKGRNKQTKTTLLLYQGRNTRNGEKRVLKKKLWILKQPEQNRKGENHLFNFPWALHLSLLQYADHTQKGVLSILGVCSKTSTQRKKEILLVCGMLQIKRTNLEKVPGFETAELNQFRIPSVLKPQNLQTAFECLYRSSSQQFKSGDELSFENEENEEDRMNCSNYSCQPRDVIDSEIFLYQTFCTVLTTITLIPTLITSYL